MDRNPPQAFNPIYGQIPVSSTSRLHPEMKPEVQYTNNNNNNIMISPPTTVPRPQALTTLAYDYFEMPKRVSQPYQFATEQSTSQHDTRGKCPCCFVGVAYFKLKNDPTASVFCNSCRQPFHICPIHKTTISGMGPALNSNESRQCQCEQTQQFLNDSTWNSCFNK
jgi:hypothetical protein